MALFWAAMRRDSISLLQFPFLSHVHVFSFEISLVCRLKYPYSCFPSYFSFRVIAVLLILPPLLFLLLWEFFTLTSADGLSLELKSPGLFSIFWLMLIVLLFVWSSFEFLFLIIIIHSSELFTSALADGFSLESEWQQVSSSFQDSSQYSRRFQ